MGEKYQLNVRGKNSVGLDCASDRQFSDLRKNLLHPVIQIAASILISGIRVEVLLNLSHSAVRFGAKPELDFDEGFKTGVQIRNAKIDKLGEFGEELFVELFVSLLGHFSFSLSAGKFGDILVWLFDQFLDFGAHRIVVKQFVVSFLDALVDVGEIGAEARDGFEDGRSEQRGVSMSKIRSCSRVGSTGMVRQVP